MSDLVLYELPDLGAIPVSEDKFGFRSIFFWVTVVVAVYSAWTIATLFWEQIPDRLSSRVTELRRNSTNIILGTTDVFTGNAEIVRPRSEDAVLKGDVVYIAEPTSDNIKKNQGLIYFSGSSGIAPDNRALADEFARAGYITVVINYWGKHQKIGQKIEGHGPWETRDPKSEPSERKRASMIKNALDYLRHNRNCTHVGGVGYSGGALPLMNLIQERPCRIEAAFMAHPGRMKTSAYGTIQTPLSLAQAWDDRSVDVRTRHEQEKELIEMVITTSAEKDAIKSGSCHQEFLGK
ncbi:hypothetical protein BPOR_0326g00040 [Botrytis porri]|uniref:Uncharacterized protein n=1 Tax=Botrytis porri TaxID=87229 RepID=A0A4Z1KJC3_9HELO|nr:hypothetical protein BPOR_0326g00040 [Botrytis porri]